jgi:group I intron endonuclease
MPYAKRLTGVYRLVNHADKLCYVGSSTNMLKRRAEHFRLLRNGEHPNYRLQAAFNSHGEDAFEWVEEVSCDEEADARELELLILKGDLSFGEVPGYNIALDAFPMLGRTHSDYTKNKISQTKLAQTKPLEPAAHKKLQNAQIVRRMADDAHREKVEYIVNNDHLSYADRARALGMSLSTVRKIYLRYADAYGRIPPPPRPSYDRDISDKVEFIRANPDKTFRMLARELGCSANSVSVLVRRYKLR